MVGRFRRERRRKRRERAAQDKPDRRPWSLPFAPLSPVPPAVEPYLPRMVGLGRRAPPTCRQRRELPKLAKEHSRRSRISSAASASGPKWADHGGSALPLPPTTDFFISGLRSQLSGLRSQLFFHLPRRWRQVGGPRRVSPTGGTISEALFCNGEMVAAAAEFQSMAFDNG
jgi:hypothetical protein